MTVSTLPIRQLHKGTGPKQGSPVHVVWIDQADIDKTGLTQEEALGAAAREIQEPAALNVIDMEVLTTTSDGLVVEGAIVMFAAADKGKIHPEFGLLPNKRLEVSDKLIAREPHLRLAKTLFPGKPLYRGADYQVKKVPIHNSVMSGRTINNNSGTEVMNAVTMEEMLLPILGQLQVMKDGEILMGLMGNVLSVGIGMSVSESFSRSQPNVKCKPGDTLHASGKYAQYLKSKLPCILAPKEVLMKHILRAFQEGLRPGVELGVSPAVLLTASALGLDIDRHSITPAAWEELEAIGIDMDMFEKDAPQLQAKEILSRAEEIIPGVKDSIRMDSKKVISKRDIPVKGSRV